MVGRGVTQSDEGAAVIADGGRDGNEYDSASDGCRVRWVVWASKLGKGRWIGDWRTWMFNSLRFVS